MMVMALQRIFGHAIVVPSLTKWELHSNTLTPTDPYYCHHYAACPIPIPDGPRTVGPVDCFRSIDGEFEPELWIDGSRYDQAIPMSEPGYKILDAVVLFDLFKHFSPAHLPGRWRSETLWGNEAEFELYLTATASIIVDVSRRL